MKISSTGALVAKIKASVYDYVVRVLHGLKYSSFVASAFDRTRTAVDGKLKDIAPQALRQFAAAFDRGLSDDPEQWSQALLSCRRILLTTANVLFPARDKPHTLPNGQSLDVGRENHMNRIRAFVHEHLPSEKPRKLLLAKVTALYDQVCKCVHGETDEFQLELALTSTYFLVGELLALCPPGFAFGPPLEEETEAQASAQVE
jgi:hypothetical protein